MEEKLKKLEAIKEELKKINLEKELTEKDKEKYIKNLEEFGKISTDAELYDVVKNVVEETEGNFDNPTTDKSIEELKRINELQNKYKSIVKDNISKRIEIIEEYAKKFDIEDLLENKQSKIAANDKGVIRDFSKYVYTPVAEKYSTKPQNVLWCITKIINLMYFNTNDKIIERYFNANISYNKPTTKAFIVGVARKLIAEKEMIKAIS